MRPNILVVVLDAGRRDALEPYGAPPGSSPAIGQLAARGRKADEVYATGCWTVPSHAGIFTGKLPRAVGLAGVPGGKPPDVKAHLAAEQERLLPEVFRRAGYRTFAASANFWVSPASGFGIGFEDFLEADSGRQAKLTPSGVRERLAWWREAVRGKIDDGAAELADRLGGLLRESDDPFFCFINMVECHSPYLPPRPFAVGSPIERIRVAEDCSRHYTLEQIWRTCLGGEVVPEAALRRLRRQYAASIRYMDDWIGRLAESLDAVGQLDDTLLVITADHGENFGEDGLIAHSLSLDNRLIHVPFVAAGPGSDASGPQSLARLPRYLAEAAGIGEHPWLPDELPEGVGVAQHDPVVERDDALATETVIERWGLDEAALVRFTTPLTCAVRGRFKLLLRGDEELLFDLDEDPLEVRPIPASAVKPSQEEAVKELRAALQHPGVTEARPFGEPGSRAAETGEVDDLEEKMRLLGYL